MTLNDIALAGSFVSLVVSQLRRAMGLPTSGGEKANKAKKESTQHA